MDLFLNEMASNPILKAICISIVADTIFGFLKALKNKNLNSSFGINGALRKCGILVASLVLFISDTLININLIPFLDENILSYVGLSDIGLTEFFGILFVAYECLSILSNMDELGIPIPKGVKSFLSKWVSEHSENIRNKGIH